MKKIIFYSINTNSEEFRREAERIGKLYDDALIIPVDCTDSGDKKQDKEERRNRVLSVLKDQNDIEFIAFVCHGWKQGIQHGFDLTNTAQLAEALKKCAAPNMAIALYCCSTANGGGPEGDGGFADNLRDLSGFQVSAHDGAGHCTRRPYVRRFEAGAPATGGAWLVDPSGPLWGKWYKALKEGDSDLRFRYPMMDRDEIAMYLQTL